MEKIIAQVKEWGLLAKLPREFAGFTLTIELKEHGTQYQIFNYQNKKWRKSFSVLYDSDTKDFFVRIVIGLTEYFDVDFIVTDIHVLEKLLVERFENKLTTLATFDRNTMGSIIFEKKILEWPYSEKLPKELVGFELFIKPFEIVKVINGSYIIIDYSDFKTESNFIIYYNIFRDEFFGEVRIRRIPEMSAFFDSSTLDELQEALETHLETVLQNMRNQLK